MSVKCILTGQTPDINDIGAQPKITIDGILKGDGTGNITAAEEAEVELVEITPELIGAAAKSKVLNVTLPTASWTGDSAPYSYNLSVTGVTATSNQEFLPALGITTEQLEALQGANIQDGGQAEGTVTLKAFGTKPTIDLPIRIILRGD